MSERKPREDRSNGSAAERRNRRWTDYVKALGPGLISGASDNDPTTVATMSVLGATTVYGLSWLVILVWPMLAVIQIISAQIGVVTKKGLQRTAREIFGARWGTLLLLSVISVNIITIGADLEGGAAALGLLFHLPYQWFLVPFAAGVIGVLYFGSYDALQTVLQYVLFVFIAYIASAFLSHPNWGAVLHDTIMPPITFNSTYIEGALALLGTTLTSYAYVWETIEESENKPPIEELGLARADAGFGMFFAVAIFWFILISTGATLGIHHKPVETAQQAAQALTPVAGPIAADLFAIGLLASSILAVPVLAATTGYTVASEFRMRGSLRERIGDAKLFYTVVGITLLVGVGVSYAGVSPIRLLFISGIIGGLGTPISLAFLLLIGRSRRAMGEHRVGHVLMGAGWATAVIVAAISLYFLWQQFGSAL